MFVEARLFPRIVEVWIYLDGDHKGYVLYYSECWIASFSRFTWVMYFFAVITLDFVL